MRLLYLLLPGCRPVPAATKGIDPATATHFAYEGDAAWIAGPPPDIKTPTARASAKASRQEAATWTR